jgi:hypothetical protein
MKKGDIVVVVDDDDEEVRSSESLQPSDSNTVF